MSDLIKKQNGVFYTNLQNPFQHSYFMEWARKNNIKNSHILEPFAGENHIIQSLKDINLCNNFTSFDIHPQNKHVAKRDTIKHFPIGYNVCITNPPWLYKSRAKRLNIPFPDTKWDNLYKHCLDMCLKNCDYVAILIPASFLNSNIFLNRLDSIILLQSKIFTDTENPVCLALFNKDKVKETNIFLDENHIGNLADIKKHLPQEKNSNIAFNVKNGALGLIAIDNTKEPSIRFCMGNGLKKYTITNSSRSITRISIKGVKVNNNLIHNLNGQLNILRKKTYDIFMTPFKGIRVDGMYRRRLDYSLAKRIISENI